MSTPSRFETKAVACEAADGELVRLLAVFAKASFTYEANSRRTMEACSAFQSTLIARVRETGAPFVLENRSDGLHTASGKVPVDPLREWWRNTLQKALLGGLKVEGGVGTQSLQRFFAQLRTTNIGKVRKNATFQTLWPDRYDGLELRELRFFGGYHAHELGSEGGGGLLNGGHAGEASGFAPDGSADLRAALSQLGLSDAQLQRILALEQRLASLQTGVEEGELMSLPQEVLATLPADVVDDPAARPVFVDRLLDRFEKRLDEHGLADDGAPLPMSGLVELFRKLPQSFFTAEIDPGAPPSPPPEVRPLPSLPTRPEDHFDELDDPASLVSLIASLPEKPISLEPNEATLQAEMLRVCLHQLGADTTPRVVGPAAARVKKIFQHIAPESVKVMEHYVRQALARNSELPTPAAVERMFQRFDQSHLLPDLRRHNVLTVERVVRFFPNGFVLFLKSLDDQSLTGGSPADAEALVRVLKGIPEASLAAGANQLLQQKEILDPVLLRRLFALGGRNSLGLARTMLSASIPAVKEQVVALLRDLGSEHAESLPVVCLEAENLPVTFLQQLCDFQRTGRPDPRLRSQSGGLLYTFIESTPNDEHSLSRKAKAIAGLAAFPGPSSENLLKQLLRGQGLLGALNVPTPIRDAVRAVRARWEEGRRV